MLNPEGRAAPARLRPVAVALAALCTLAGQPEPRANPVDLFGFGARAAAMAGAHTAAADDGSANYYNPAVLSTFEDIRIDLGYLLAAPNLSVGGLDVGVDDVRGAAVALSAPGRIAGQRVAIGVGLHLPDQHITRTRALAATKPRFVIYDNRPQRIVMSVNASVAVTDRLSLGAGISYMSRTLGNALLAGRVGFPDAEDSELALDIDVDLRTVRYAQMGALYRATPWLTLGVSYRGGFTLILDQVFEVRGDVGPDSSAGEEPLVDDGFLLLHTISQDLFQPAQINAGLDAQLTRDLALAFDVQWQRWSAFENPAARLELDLDVGQFNDLINVQPQPPLPDPRFHDTVVPRLGLEWTAARSPRRDVAVRAGYSYEPSPVPQQFGETNFIDADKHTVAAGAGLTLRGLTEILPRPLSLDAAVALTMLAPRSQQKISPIDPVGDWRATGRVLQLAVTSRWRF